MILSILGYYSRIPETEDFDEEQIYFLTSLEQGILGASHWQPVRASCCVGQYRWTRGRERTEPLLCREL